MDRSPERCAAPARSGTSSHLHRYLLGWFATLRREPGDDVISALLTSPEAGELGDDDLFWVAMMLIVAGNETTTDLIGSLLLALAEGSSGVSASARGARADPPAVEEATRWGSRDPGAVPHCGNRLRGRAVDHPGRRTRPVLFGAANRDPSVYTDPDRFVVDRRPTTTSASAQGSTSARGRIWHGSRLGWCSRSPRAGRVDRARRPSRVARQPVRHARADSLCAGVS